jgi:hypothetical protein
VVLADIYTNDTSIPYSFPVREERSPHIILAASCVKAPRSAVVVFGIIIDKLCGLAFWPSGAGVFSVTDKQCVEKGNPGLRTA